MVKTRRFALIAALATSIFSLATCGTLSREDKQKELGKSVVRVLAPNMRGGGTGFAVESDAGRVIVTNAHVCEAAENGVLVIEQNGRKALSRILKHDTAVDLCAITDDLELPVLTIGRGSPYYFQPISVLGHPRLEQLTPEHGVYLSENLVQISMRGFADVKSTEQADTLFDENSATMIFVLGETTVRIFPGNSGSPALDSDGEVVGVFNSADNEAHKGLIIPVRHLRKFLGK